MGEVYIPQDMNYPALRLNVDRVHAGELGLTQKEVVDNVITALNSNSMIAPNYWVDRKSGNDYFLTVQYFEKGATCDPQLNRSDEHPNSRSHLEASHHAGHRRKVGEHPDAD